MKLLIIFALTTLVMVTAAQSQEPSSEIPAKREFPLNSKVNPCENFHQYVCSKVETSFKLRDDRSYHTFAFNDSSERILEAKKDFFANIEKEKNLSPRSQQIKAIYQACANEKEGVKNEKKYLSKLLGEVEKIKNPKEFANLMLEKIPKGEGTLVSFGAYSNQDDPKKLDIYLMVDLRFLPEHSYYENADLMKDYEILLNKFFSIVEPKQETAEREKRVKAMLELEKKFNAIYPHPEVIRQRWAEKRQESQKDFIAKYPNAHFDVFLKRSPKTTLISNSIPEGLQFYNDHLNDQNLNQLKDIYLFSEATSYLDDSQPEFFKSLFDFKNKYLGGPLVRPVRHERCTKSAMYSFMKETDQLLIDRLFPQFPEKKFKAVAEKIREAIIEGIEKNTWLEESSRKTALLKMKTAKLYLVKPQNDKEWDFLPVKKYSKSDRFSNSTLLSRTRFDRDMDRLKSGANLEAWDMGPLIVNAYYDPSANKFVMPMGILQFPFFIPEGDLIENLGAVGAVIGHELGHGVDDMGSKYDETGKLRQWMSMKDLAEFSNRGRKLIDQFNKAGHNGTLTLGENIGDLVGLTFAYRAAQSVGFKSVEDEKKLFIAYGRLWCTVARPKAEEQQLKTDPHALGWARINEQVKHQPGFAKAFNCKPNDKMVLPPESQVQIW